MKQAFILGATSPVGCRLAEMLHERGVTVVALIKEWSSAARLARLPVRMIEGRTQDTEGLGLAMRDCDLVIDCADDIDSPASSRTTAWRGAVESAWRRLTHREDPGSISGKTSDFTEAVLRTAAERQARIVKVTPAAMPAETLRQYHERGVSITMLRPATLYGPFCRWTIDAVRTVREGLSPVGGPARCLYIDHLAEAVLTAAGTDAGRGESFMLFDPEPASCEELFAAHSRALTVDSPAVQSGANSARTARDEHPDLQRARSVLGYNPTSGFAENMARTAAWIRWARL